MKNILGIIKRKMVMAMVAIMAITSVTTTSVFAKDIESETSNTTVQPRAGVETLPYGGYSIGAFTFTDTNLTPVKTVQGRKISLFINFTKAASDRGIGPVKLSVQIRDTAGNALSDVYTYSQTNENDELLLIVPEIDLGTTGRQIQIWFDASSVGASNGNFRSIEVFDFQSYVE